WPSRHQSRRWDPQTSVSLSAASCRPLPLSSLRNFTCTPSGHRNDLSTLYVPPPAIVLHRPMRGIDDQELFFCLDPEGRRRNYTDALRVFWWLALLNISLAFSLLLPLLPCHIYILFGLSQEEITKEFEEKKAELQPKVVEIYETSTVEIKLGLKKKSAVVIKFIEELVKIEFPGAKPVSEAASKHGPALVSGPVIFIFEKVSTLLPAEPEPEPEPAAAIETTSKEITPEAAVESKKEEAEKAEEEAPAPPAPAEEALAPEPEPAKA
ncbi:hypothetical protein B296_00053531, partial [Ensete ventricosum]